MGRSDRARGGPTSESMALGEDVDPWRAARLLEMLADEIGSSIAISTHLRTEEVPWTGAIARRCAQDLDDMVRDLIAERDRLAAEARRRRHQVSTLGP